MDEDTERRVLAYWRDNGRDEYLVHGKAHIYDMCDFAVSACGLDMDIDDYALRRLAIRQAREWGVDWVN